MKIAYVYDAVYPWVTGGIERRVWELSRRLSEHHEVHLYGWRYWGSEDTLKRNGVQLHGVASPPSTLYVDGRRSILPALSFAYHLVRPLRREDFDVLDCQQFPYFPSFASKLGALRKKSTMVLTWHEVWGQYWYDYLGYKGFAGKLIEESLAHLPDRHVAVSKRTQHDAESLGADSPTLVPNGVDLNRISEISPADEDIDVLFAGRLIESKNVSLLLEAIGIITETHPSIRCSIVGEGPERETLQSKISELGIEDNVSIEDFHESHDEVVALMKAADTFVSPSRREGFGLTALEALASGTPVVTVNAPRNAAQDLVDDGTTGFVCDETASDLATAIIASRRKLKGTACVAAAKPYDWDVITDRVTTVYEEVSG